MKQALLPLLAAGALLPWLAIGQRSTAASDLPRAAALLVCQGYRPMLKLNCAQEAAHLATLGQLPFVHNHSAGMVELSSQKVKTTLCRVKVSADRSCEETREKAVLISAA